MGDTITPFGGAAGPNGPAGFDWAGLFKGISGGSLLGGGLLGGAGSLQSGFATAAADRYRAQIAENNAKLARQTAQWQQQAANTQVSIEGQKTRAQVGAIHAAQAASGVEADSGSALDVRSSARELGQLNALTISSNAARQVYNTEVEASSQDAQAKLDKQEATNAEISGGFGAAKSLLGTASSVGNQWAKWQEATGGQPGTQATWF